MYKSAFHYNSTALTKQDVDIYVRARAAVRPLIEVLFINFEHYSVAAGATGLIGEMVEPGTGELLGSLAAAVEEGGASKLVPANHPVGWSPPLTLE